MKIVFGFVGGSLDDYVSSGDSENRTPDGEATIGYYCDSNNGTVGSRFSVPNDAGDDIYEVVMRLENGNNVIVRAIHVAHEPSADDLDKLIVRR